MGTCIIAALVGMSNVLGRLYYDVIVAERWVLAGVIAGTAIGIVLLLCIVCGTCIRRMRK